MTDWNLTNMTSESLLAQQSSILDLILQEDGGALVIDYGTIWNLKTAN